MKNVYLWWGICSLFFIGGCTQKQINLAVPGVSKELAVSRKASVSDLKYKLEFHLPAQQKEAVKGKVEISFHLSKPEQIILDFREDRKKIKQITVNGQLSAYRFEKEHIIIPVSESVVGFNRMEIVFIAGDRSLNRNEDYMYTLLVPDRARTLFPCFDQPDLKARFTLSLRLPQGWQAVSNAPEKDAYEADKDRWVCFAETEPLSTYLFSFVAGRFERAFYTQEGRDISIYHRETDPQRVAQLPLIAGQVFGALNWMEEYTGIPYPFAKYDLIILPGFQFGGMEHTGATLYNDNRMFLTSHPTVNEELGRAELIAHETAHMWFGDYVTMKWFDDVWTKEVFANFFAAKMIKPLFPAVNHTLNDLKNFYAASYSEDRTAGSNAIKQDLGNLKDAGLVYGQIIYNKAPIVMQMLEKQLGEEAFRKGIQEYLDTYAYSNADWEGLMDILDRYTPVDLKKGSHIWVHEKGLPEISARKEKGWWWLVQRDTWNRGIQWAQPVSVMFLKGDSIKIKEVLLEKEKIRISLAAEADIVVPGGGGKGYGYFALDTASLSYGLKYWKNFQDPLHRMSILMALYENKRQGKLKSADFLTSILTSIQREENPLIYSVLLGYLESCCADLCTDKESIQKAEEKCLTLMYSSLGKEYRLGAFRTLLRIFRSPSCSQKIYTIWRLQQLPEGLYLSERDYMNMTYELCIRLPEKSEEMLEIQQSRITNPDRRREFNYVARALSPCAEIRDSLFFSLLKAENRQIEPWTLAVISYLNHPLRQKEALKYIRPALEALEDIQRTGDIFFPKNWVAATLRGHRSPAAANSVRDFLEAHPSYPPLLRNKILQSADHLLRLE